jgi:hypothetical protein
VRRNAQAEEAGDSRGTGIRIKSSVRQYRREVARLYTSNDKMARVISQQ